MIERALDSLGARAQNEFVQSLSGRSTDVQRRLLLSMAFFLCIQVSVWNAVHLQTEGKQQAWEAADFHLSHDASRSRATTHVLSPRSEIQDDASIKRNHNDSARAKIPLPVFVMGMPKAGTSSIAQFFHCGTSLRISHYDCHRSYRYVKGEEKTAKMTCGKRMRRNIKRHKPPFEGIDHFDVYTELDAYEKGGGMTMPQLDFLQDIYLAFPNATWILNRRRPDAWLSSVDRWKELRQRFVNNRFGEWFYKGIGTLDTEMLQFYNYTLESVRKFARQHPSLNFVEVPIDVETTGVLLEEAFGIRRSCWGQYNRNQPKNFSIA